jgi:GTP cyclohydrolase II
MASSDVKTYGVGAQILSDLGVGKMRILGSPRKLNALKGFGLEVVEYGTLSFVVHISSSPILLPKTNMIRIIND